LTPTGQPLEWMAHPMAKPATLQAVASSLGLSKTTVSVALRGRPGVSDDQRARILAEAERLGYKPNPVAAELMAMVRSQRQTKRGETIAFINTFQEDPTLLHRVPGLRLFLDGAMAHAAVVGYRVEEFSVKKGGMSAGRLDQVLKARGIRGVLVGPRWFDEPEIELDWSAYSCVLVGETTYGAGIYRVCNHHAYSTELALTRLPSLGYRRIGLELASDYESVRRFDFLSGVEPARRIVGDSAEIVVRLVPRRQPPDIKQYPPEERTERFRVFANQQLIPDIERWVRAERLDALITLEGYDERAIRRINTHRGFPLGFARLDTRPEENCAGVNQHSADVGRTAMDLLRGLLLSGERGVTPRPRMVLVEGEWLDGPTAPPISDLG
jgi:LacI family transcriptional regulator